MKAYGTKERIIERNRYRPLDEKKAKRTVKFIAGMERTEKRKGDIVLLPNKTHVMKTKTYL